MLVIYKGYEFKYLEDELNSSLLDSNIEDKINLINKKDDIAPMITEKITNLHDVLMKQDRWITYEEFSICRDIIIELSKVYKFEIVILNNNKYYNIYPLEVYDKKYLDKIIKKQNDNKSTQEDDNEKNIYDDIYSYVYKINEKYYVQYFNYEYDNKNIKIKNRYNGENIKLEKSSDVDYIFEIDDNVEKYIQNILECYKYKKIGIAIDNENVITKEMLNGLKGYLASVNIKQYIYINEEEIKQKSDIYKKIAIEKINIPNFKKFRSIKIYKNPDENNEIKTISQEDIINDIVKQIDISKSKDDNKKILYRDIFVTSPTGSGKSIMFQIPAIYAAEKYGSLTIVISPLVELMNDQVENLRNRGYNKAERINSDISAYDKSRIIKDINDGKIDILYLSPEALLSYSIETIIGQNRDISTIIVDEAHIVTTWGQGFRPDYWYLGSYIEKLRRKRYKGGVLDINSRVYNFPICTFTATAVNGGKNDGVSEICQSLYLKDPIKYIGEIKRNDIKFDITINNENLNRTDTEIKKAELLEEKIEKWQDKKEKTLVYFPYNSIAKDAYNASGNYSNLKKLRDKIGIYTGKTITYDEKSKKKESAKKFKTGEYTTMFATKAFGMGIDIKDIKHVYHYAEAGNLNDYVQEIGRVARDEKLEGIAHMDYFKKDINFSNVLFGMSAIKQYHVNGVIKVLNNIYKKSHKRNNLITAKMFEVVFPKVGDIESSVKTTLLNIEKDLYLKYKIPIIKTRPRSMFTTTYAVIDNDIKEQFLSSVFGKYFNYVNQGRNKEVSNIGNSESECKITDSGDVYYVNLKSMWEDNFDKYSFPQFKRMFYSQRDSIFKNYADKIYPRTKIEIHMLDENMSLSNAKSLLLGEMQKVNDIIKEFQMQQGEFTIQEFKNELKNIYNDNNEIDNIANGYFKSIEDERSLYGHFYTRIEREVTKYKIINSSYRKNSESIIYKSSLLNEMQNIKANKVIKYKPSESIDKVIKILNLLYMFNIAQFNMAGGQDPEIFIRINDPARINAIATGRIPYKNDIVAIASKKHKEDVQIMQNFICNLKTDSQRWNFIEEYFLGKDLL